MKAIALVFAALLLGTAASHAAEAWKEAEVGGTKIYTDAKGMTLYTFGKDADGKSACVEQCAVNWPPLKAEAGAAASGDWTVVTRADGSSQWAYKGRPLYAFVKDKKAGDVTGDGLMSGAWKVAQP